MKLRLAGVALSVDCTAAARVTVTGIVSGVGSPGPYVNVTVPLFGPGTRPGAAGFAVIVILDDVFAASGETVSQLAELLVVNDTAADGEVVNVTCVDSEAVEPEATVAGVQVVRLGVTLGGAVPVATRVAFERLKLPELLFDDKTKFTVPEKSPTDGTDAGTAVTIYPFGSSALAERVASPAKSQLLMLSVSPAPTLSVSDTVTAGVEVALQVRLSPSTAIPIVIPL